MKWNHLSVIASHPPLAEARQSYKIEPVLILSKDCRVVPPRNDKVGELNQ